MRQPRTGEYGESLLSGPPITTDELAPGYSDAEGATSRARSGTEDSEQPVRGGGRATRSAGRSNGNSVSNPRKRKHIDTYNSIDEMSDEAETDASGDEWDSDKNDAEDEHMPDANDDDDDEMSEADEESELEDQEPQSLILKLKIPSAALSRFENGTSTPRSEASHVDEAAEAGAPKYEAPDQGATSGLAFRSNAEAATQQQPGSSPMGSSAYPTPTSSSFLPTEQKVAVAPAPSVQPATYPSFGTQVVNQGLANGVHKIEYRSYDSEKAPQSLFFHGHPHSHNAGSGWP